jgi:hypothetical protein
MRNTQLTELPEWLDDLSCLTRLILRSNHLVESPASLGNLAQLTTLDSVRGSRQNDSWTSAVWEDLAGTVTVVHSGLLRTRRAED